MHFKPWKDHAHQASIKKAPFGLKKNTTQPEMNEVIKRKDSNKLMG